MLRQVHQNTPDHHAGRDHTNYDHLANGPQHQVLRQELAIVPARLKQSAGWILRGNPWFDLAHFDDQPGQFIKPQAGLLHQIVVRLLQRLVVNDAGLLDGHGEFRRKMKELRKYMSRELARKFGTDLTAARFNERLQQPNRDLAHRRLQRLHLFVRKERIQSAAIRGMIRRIEVQWRPPAGERYLRYDVLN